MKRYGFIILFLVVLAAPFVLRQVVGGRESLPAGTSTQRRLVIITPHNQDIRREFARAFSEWHLSRFGESVEIDYRVPGGTNDIKRQLADTYRSWRTPDGSLDPGFRPDVHIVWGGGPFFHDKELKPLGVLQPIRIDSALLTEAFPSSTLAGVRLYEESADPDGTPTPKWVGVCFSAFGIVYNPDVLSDLGIPAPAQWQDLTDPRYVGQLALADPTHSGSAATAYMVVIQRRMADAEEALLEDRPDLKQLSKTQLMADPAWQEAIAAGWKRGMGDLLLIAANGRYFVDSAPQVPSDVGNGDAAAGIAIDFYGRVYQDVVGPDRCRVVLPKGATAITADPVAILAGVSGAELELAQRFVEFLLTRQGQQLWILRPGVPGGPAERALRRLPVRRDLYTGDRTGWTDDVNPFADAGGFNQRPEFETLFSDTRLVWTAAWIDSREALRSAYHAILQVADFSQRDTLLAELADLPITMQDVANAREERRRIEASGHAADEWRARRRIELVKRFRAHYQEVGAKTRQ